MTAEEIDRMQAELFAWRAFGRFLLDDFEPPADLHGMLVRVQSDVPRLLRGELNTHEGDDGRATHDQARQ